MSTVTASIAVGDDSARVIAGILKSFPKGQRVRVAVTEEVADPNDVASVDGFRARLDEARKLSPICPWETTESALAALREGEPD